MLNLQGVWVPLTTPFTFEGELYRTKVAHNVARLNLTSVAGYVVGSSTGEAETLGWDEQLELFHLVASAAGPTKVKIAGVSRAGVREAVQLSHELITRGAQAILLESPWSGPEHDLYCRTIADRVDVPVLAGVAGHPNIQAAPAILPPLANALPYAYITVYEAERTREQEAADDWRARLAPAEQVIARHSIPALKYAMELTGYYGGPPRLPRVAISPAVQGEVEQALAGLRS
ncbi:MAG: dihydrodipicolinate synthase family protein [Acidobacteria bacterium]|nr:dihydrodipicolinate synthase family protein [Acidobacteriota bacterium]